MKFEKVSFTQFKNSIIENGERDGHMFDDHEIEEMYTNLKTPKRATRFSAGYDFYAPFGFLLEPGQTITIPLGIKFKCNNDKFLMCVPCSGIGYKYKIQLYNTCGIIDADFYNNPTNEGNISVKFFNDSPSQKDWIVQEGQKIMQGIILKYFKVSDDESNNKRTGGIGSTSKELEG